MSTRPLIPITIALLMAVPAGAAGWGGKGSAEPSTAIDRSGNFMYQDATDSYAGNKVYFNGFLIDSDGLVTSETLNSAIVGSQIEPVHSAPMVLFGVWRDCNRDGYIGDTDVHYVYRSELLMGDPLCPVSHTFPTHNDGTWVYEFNPISWNNDTYGNVACCDANVFVDNRAMAWADATLPDDVIASTCTVNPEPPGTFHGTGGLLGYADCNDGYTITHLINGAATTTGLDLISFADRPDGDQNHSASVLNVHYGLGENGDQSDANAFDCSDPNHRVDYTQRDPTNGQVVTLPVLGPESVHQQTVPGVVIITLTDSQGRINKQDGQPDDYLNPNLRSQPSVNPSGSVVGTLNVTQRSATHCDPNRGVASDQAYCTSYYTCEASDSRAFTGRVQPDATLVSEEWPHSYLGHNTNDPVVDLEDKAFGEIVGADFRQQWFTFDHVDSTGSITRDGPAEARHWSFYGFVSPTAVGAYNLLLKSGGATGSYGASACAKSASDHLVRFDCDATHWWRKADGSEISPKEAADASGSFGGGDPCAGCDPRAFVGQPFNLLDVDCYDQSVQAARELGLTAPAIVTGNGC